MTAIFEDHLTLDAIVAFTDGEMSMIAYQRAAAHLARCPHCAAEVDEQVAAREFLRSAGAPRMPGSLLDALRSIPVALPGICAPVSPLQMQGPMATQREQRGARHRRFRLGAGALVAGLTLGVSAGVADAAPDRVEGRHTALPSTAPVLPDQHDHG